MAALTDKFGRPITDLRMKEIEADLALRKAATA